jgi:hypothetical protein
MPEQSLSWACWHVWAAPGSCAPLRGGAIYVGEKRSLLALPSRCVCEYIYVYMCVIYTHT